MLSPTGAGEEMCAEQTNFEVMDGVTRDIHEMMVERDRYMMALLKSEAKYRALSEAGLEAIVIHRDGKVIATNKSFQLLTGYTETELTPDVMWGSIVPEQLEEVKSRIKNENIESYRMNIINKNGHKIDVYARIRYVEYNGMGRCRAVVLTPWIERSEQI